MRNAWLDESQAGVKIAGRNINSLRYADDTTLMAEIKEELKRLLMKVQEEREKDGLKLNIWKITIMVSGPISSVQFSHSVVSSSLRLHESQHARPPCPSLSPRVHSDSRSLSQWCHPAISSSVVPFFSCLQSFPALGSFLKSQLFTSGGQSTGASASAFSSVQSLSHVRLCATPWIAARQAPLFITNSRSSLRFMFIESVMPSSHLILCRPLLLLPPIPPSIRVFSNESTLRMRWPKFQLEFQL